MSYGGRNDDFGPKPVEAGKEYDVQITEISRKGDGIARVQGFVIFVKVRTQRSGLARSDQGSPRQKSLMAQQLHQTNQQVKLLRSDKRTQ
jgi:tRNA/tmRNA/rRNA uracil-C5-methylase (TrmA/RlmC/RlmD family)